MRVIDVICFVPMYEFSPQTGPPVLNIISFLKDYHQGCLSVSHFVFFFFTSYVFYSVTFVVSNRDYVLFGRKIKQKYVFEFR